jgi:hypothetical protein
MDAELPRHIAFYASLQNSRGDFALRARTANEPGAADNRVEPGEDVGKAVHRFRRKVAVNDPESFCLQLPGVLLSGFVGGWTQEDADRSGAFRILRQQAGDNSDSQFSRANDKSSGEWGFCFCHQALHMILMANKTQGRMLKKVHA